jgi:hypothetical protein
VLRKEELIKTRTNIEITLDAFFLNGNLNFLEKMI